MNAKKKLVDVKKLDAAWRKHTALRAEAARMWAKSFGTRTSAHGARAKARYTRAKADGIAAKAEGLWAKAVLKCVGNVNCKWTWKTPDGECEVEGVGKFGGKPLKGSKT